MPSPASPSLSGSQLETFARLGEERTAEVGEVLYRIGDHRYPFIAIIDGEAAIQDANGHEIIRQGASGFLGEISLLSGQTVYLTAVVTQPMRYIAVDRDDLRSLLFDDGPLSDLLLSTFIDRREALQQTQGIGLEILGPRSSHETRRIVEYAGRSRLPYTWRDPEHSDDGEATALIGALDPGELPLVRLPGGMELRNPSNGEVSRALGIGLDLEAHEEVDLVVIGGGPAGLGAAVYGASEGLETLVVESTVLGGQAGTSRRIENYLGFPAGISGGELAARALLQAKKFGARLAMPAEAVDLVKEDGHFAIQLADGSVVNGRTVIVATGAQYRKLDVPDLERYEGLGVYYAATLIEAQMCTGDAVLVVGGGNSAGQAAIFLSQHAASCRLLIRGCDRGKSMSRYLVDEIERREGIEVLTHSEIVELQGETALEAAVVADNRSGARAELPAKAVFVFIGASPHTGWLDGRVAMDEDGFLLTGGAVDGADLAAFGPDDAPYFLETSQPGIFAVGDVRSGSIKRVASGAGEGSMAVQLVHQRLAAR
jgi:thioredoxin reductase (NADPH)